MYQKKMNNLKKEKEDIEKKIDQKHQNKKN